MTHKSVVGVLFKSVRSIYHDREDFRRELFFLCIVLHLEKEDGYEFVKALVTWASLPDDYREGFKSQVWVNYLMKVAERIIYAFWDIDESPEDYPSWTQEKGFGQTVMSLRSDRDCAEYMLQALMVRLSQLLDRSQWDVIYRVSRRLNVGYQDVLQFLDPICSVANIAIHNPDDWEDEE